MKMTKRKQQHTHKKKTKQQTEVSLSYPISGKLLLQ